MSKGFESTLAASYTREHYAVTAGGQMTVGVHSEALPPVSFRIDIPVMAMPISRSNPYRVFTGRLFPPASLPGVGFTIPTVVSANPDVLPAWASGAVFVDADRGTKFYDDLRMGRYYPKGKAKQRGQKNFSHSCFPGIHGARGWPLGHITIHNQERGPTT
jgi:hypothetical protein